jgi:type I restriction enzyme M protein
VIGLAANLFYGTGIPACVLIINKEKEAARRGKVLFVNGAEEMVEGKNQNTLSKDNAKRLAQAFVAFEDKERFARVVELEEIKKNDFNLNIARYVQTAEEKEQIDVAAEVMVLKRLLEKRDEAESKMLGFLKELGYE